jgi:uncharacterized protein involved in copper resistance
VKRDETLRANTSRDHEANRPNKEKNDGDRKANHQKTPEQETTNAPATTTKTSVDVAVPSTTGTTRTATGRLHVENAGTTAVATIEVAMVD